MRTPAAVRILRLRSPKFAPLLFTLFSGLICAYPRAAAATADALYVNHVTRQLAVFEDDDFTGIFWEPLAAEDAAWKRAERAYTAKGYRYTRSPAFLDGYLAALLIGALVIEKLRRMRRVRRNRRKGESR